MDLFGAHRLQSTVFIILSVRLFSLKAPLSSDVLRRMAKIKRCFSWYDFVSHWCFHARNFAPWVLWTGPFIVIFWQTYNKYSNCPEYFYLHNMLGNSLSWSRGAAAVLWFSCSLMLLPMCRNLLAFVRNTLCKSSRRLRRLLDKHIWFHKACAITTIIAAVVHTVAHLINGKRFSENYSTDHPPLNFAKNRDQDPLEFVMLSVAGFTGMGMMLVLLIMIAASTPIVRNRSYEVFWFTHHAFIAFYLMLAVHGLGGVIKHQTNLAAHTPGCKVPLNDSMDTPFNMTSLPLCREAEFAPDQPQSWKLLILPLSIYLIDRLIRVVRGYQEVTVIKVVNHPCGVIELHMKKSGFYAEPGQFVYVRCHSVARFEWHPFTLTKCPSSKDDSFSIHIKRTGDWTSRITDQVTSIRESLSDQKTLLATLDDSGSLVAAPSVRLSVDGPYGSPCMDVEEYRVSMCIATGIGVTPFAALITRIRSQIIHAQRPPRPHRLYFVWICREVGALQWFADLIHETSRQLWELNRPDFLTCLFYTTTKGQKEKICINHTQSSWFDARLTHGRPDWFQIFRRVSQENPRTCVGVFYCGARGPSSKLRRCCQRMYKNGASFVFNKEVSA
ncbi:NADPH oxidase 4 isoform X2 [Nematostella vectensis]|uniref:NADPH oxidase 4 isoform X2 n=1 Tax=Nematostella vectensis TaxID=45351 RepID=UPI0020771800|nr:NADPH oxidase 4 isoform X2 [Nematostella vectensis]